MNLLYGENEVVYIIAHNPDQKTELKVKVFLYKPHVRMVVSDIDGTITK